MSANIITCVFVNKSKHMPLMLNSGEASSIVCIKTAKPTACAVGIVDEKSKARLLIGGFCAFQDGFIGGKIPCSPEGQMSPNAWG